MKIFEKRPLCLILCIMLGGFSFSVNSSKNSTLILLVLPVIIFSLTLIPGVINKSKIILTRIVSLSLLLSVLLGMLFTYVFLPRRHYGKEQTIEALVVDVSYTDTYQKVILKTTKISGSKAKYKLVYYNYDKYLNIGDTVECEASIESIEEDSDFRSLNYSRGISGIIKAKEITLTQGTPKEDSIFIRSRKHITKTLIDSTNQETGGFMSALITGDQSNLDPALNLSFRRLGLSHILALSGMNIALLTHAVERILYILRVAKRKRMIISSVFTVMYMALVGFTPSITRAGIMMIIYYVLHLVAKTSDSLTSLSLAVFLIVLVNPNSIFDISLMLSAFATLGILTLTELSDRNEKKRSIYLAPLFYFINSVVSSFFAISMTLILTVFTFKSLSPVSLITTALFSPIVEIYIYLGMILPFVGWFLPLEKPIMLITDLIKWSADKMSEPWWVTARADHFSLRLMTVIMTLIIAAFLIFEIKRKKLILVSLASVLIALMGLSTYISTTRIYPERVIYSTNSTYDTILATDSGEVTVITSELLTVNNMYYISDTITEFGISKIDNLVISGYSYKYKELSTLIEYVRCDVIYVPYPRYQDELKIAKELSDLLSGYGTTLRFYKINDSLAFGSMNYTLRYYSPIRYGERYDSIYDIETDGRRITYFSENAHNTASDKILYNTEKSNAWILGVASSDNTGFNIYLEAPKSIIIGKKNRIESELEAELIESGVKIIFESALRLDK